MKNKILDALKAKFEGVSDAILGRIADKLAKTVTTEDGVQPAVDGIILQQVIDGEADRRATEATQTAVTNYEKKHSLKEGKPVNGGEQEAKIKPDEKEGDGKVDTPAWAKALIESNKAFGEKLAALEGEKVTTLRKQKLDAAIEKLPDSLKKPYERISLKGMTDDEFNVLITETTKEVEGLIAELSAKGAVMRVPPKNGKENAGKEPSKEDAAKVLEGLI